MPSTITETVGTGGDYTTMFGAEAGTDGDLIGDDEIRELRMLESLGPGGGAEFWSGENSSATQYRDIGLDDITDLFDPDDGTGITYTVYLITSANHQHWHDIAIIGDGETSALQMNGEGQFYEQMYFRGDSFNATIQIGASGLATPYTIYRNCVIVHITNANVCCAWAGSTYNPTVQNCLSINFRSHPSADGFVLGANTGVFTNVISIVNHNNATCFENSGSPTFTNCLSTDNTGGDSTTRTDTDILTGPTSSDEDYSPVATGPADEGQGTDLSGTFTRAYHDGTVHDPNSLGWNIGPLASPVSAAPFIPAKPINVHIRR